MSFFLLKKVPRYECLFAASRKFSDLDPSACEVFLHLLQTGDEAFRLTDANLSRQNLSQGRFMVLLLLLGKQTQAPHTCTPAELAELAWVTRATMTGLVDTLERDGLVKREPDSNDRRMLAVSLTAKGQALIAEVLPPQFRLMAAMMQSLDEAERKTLVRLLTKIREQAARLATPPTMADQTAVSPT